MNDDKSRTEIRRKSRAVNDDNWIRAFLKRAPYGTMATAVDNQPFMNINTFAYDEDENAIYFHGALRGRTRSNIELNRKVCYSVAEMGRLLPAETAFGFSVEYSSVIVFGNVELITDPNEARKGLELLMTKYFPHLISGKDYAPITEHDLKITSVYKIKIEEWSGKQKKEPSNFPGAFDYPAGSDAR